MCGICYVSNNSIHNCLPMSDPLKSDLESLQVRVRSTSAGVAIEARAGINHPFMVVKRAGFKSVSNPVTPVQIYRWLDAGAEPEPEDPDVSESGEGGGESDAN